jgi:ankyrin repeat protein
MDYGIDIDAIDVLGHTALFLAAETCNIDKIWVLLKACGAKPDVQDNEGNTFLHVLAFGCQRRHPEYFETIEEIIQMFPVMETIRNKDGCTVRDQLSHLCYSRAPLWF